MLDYFQIQEMEQAWQTYKQNRRKKYKIFFYVAFVIVLICLLWAVIYTSFSAGRSEIAQSNALSIQSAQNKLEQARLQQLKNQALHKSNARDFTATINTPKEEKIAPEVAKYSEDFKASTNEKTTAQVLAEKSVAKPEISQNLTLFPDFKAQEAANMPFLDFALPKLNPNLVAESEFKDKANKQHAKKAPEIISNIPAQSTLKAQTSSKSTDEISYLEQRYNETKSQYFALDIANAYLAQKDYGKAQKWALVANGIDELNEQSWLIFAKAKAASGDVKEAKRVLKSYLAKNPGSTSAINLLEKFENQLKGL